MVACKEDQTGTLFGAQLSESEVAYAESCPRAKRLSDSHDSSTWSEIASPSEITRMKRHLQVQRRSGLDNALLNATQNAPAVDPLIAR